MGRLPRRPGLSAHLDALLLQQRPQLLRGVGQQGPVGVLNFSKVLQNLLGSRLELAPAAGTRQQHALQRQGWRGRRQGGAASVSVCASTGTGQA